MRIKKNERLWYVLFLLLPYLKPYNITLIPSVDAVFKVWKVISTAVIVFMFITQKAKLDKRMMCLFLFCAIWIVSLIINKGPITDYVNNIFSIIGISLLFGNIRNNERTQFAIYKALYGIGAIYMILNLITAIVGHPFFATDAKLTDNANFLGGDNYSAFILLVMNGLMFFYDEEYKNDIRIRTWFFSLLGIISLIIPFALTGIISYALLLSLVAFNKYNFIRKVINWKSALGLGILIVIFVSYGRGGQIFSGILTALGKEGFNGRIFVWPKAIDAIVHKPIIGYGGVTDEQAQTWILAGMNHTHNIVLQYLFSVGIIGTMPFVAYFYYTIKRFKYKLDSSSKTLLDTLIAFLICSIFDFYIGLIYFYLLLEVIQTKKTMRGRLNKWLNQV